MNDINLIRQRVIRHCSASENYTSYGNDLRSIDAFFSFVYEQTPQRIYAILYNKEEKKYYASPYYDAKATKSFPENEACNYEELFQTVTETLSKTSNGYVACTFDNDITLIFTELGLLKISVDDDNGNVRRLSVRPYEDNKETVDQLSSFIISSIKTKPSNAMDKNHYRIAYVEEGGIDTMECEFDDWTTDIENNYNDDVPYDAINKEIRSDKPSLVLMYGSPGTGKSSLIKSLINDNLDKEFIYVDSSMLTSLSNGQFLGFLNDHKGSIFILEDCEKALSDREVSQNDVISTILNITDGIVAESLKCKLICTFNCSVDKIDKALLRKGRLSIIYEFTKLSLEKTRKIYPNAKEPMTLGDAHNALEDDTYAHKEKKKIGF